MALRALLRPLSDIDRRTEGAWADLSARAAEPNPFFEPIVVLALARHVGLDVALLTVEQGADMVACLPLLSQTVRWHRLPLRVWKTWNPLGTPLVAADYAEAALASAVSHLAAVRGPRWLVLDWLATDGPVAAALESATVGRRPAWPREFARPSRPALRRRDDGAYLTTTLHGKHKRKLAWARRFLERLLGEPLRIVDEGGHADAVERLLSIEVGGWKGRIGSAVLCRPDRADYFREVCARFADQGRLQVLSLQGAGTTVAMKCDIRSRGTTFGLRTAYDERFAQGSPGVQIEIDAVGAFHASGDLFADSCTNHIKNPQAWLWPDTRSLTCFVVTLGGVIGRVTTSRLALAARRIAGVDAPRQVPDSIAR